MFSAAQYRRSILDALRYVQKNYTGSNQFPVGTFDFSPQRFRRTLAAAELACGLDEPGAACNKIFNQFVEATQNIYKRE